MVQERRSEKMAMNAEQLQVMTQVIAETLKQIHDAKTVPGGPTFSSGEDNMKDFIKEMVNQFKSSGGGQGHHNRPILDERNFWRLEKFSNKETDWEAWQANVEVAVAAVHWSTSKVMEEVAKMEVVDEEKLEEIYTNIALDKNWDEDLFMKEIGKACGELYQHLCLWTTGEANTIVRGVREKDGFIAWRRLLTKFAPRTAARRLQAMMTIMRPSKAKDVRSFGKMLESWELSVAAFKANFNEKLSMSMQVAVVIGMAPAEIQDIIFQQWKGEGGEVELEKDWKLVRDKIMALVANRVSMSTPVPMEIGEIGQDWHKEGDESGIDERELNIDAVGGKGDGKCRRCGGKGHFARECPTPMGKGIEKGSKGQYGKGEWQTGYAGKGEWQGGYAGKGLPPQDVKGKGKGKVFQGACFKCGKIGHRSAECRQVAAIEEEEEEVEVGSVWIVGSVELEVDKSEEPYWKIVKGKKTRMKKDKVVEEEIEINQVSRDGWDSFGKAVVTVDSAADESVCPKDWANMFDLQKIEEGKELRLRSANGGKIAHYGQRDVVFEVAGEKDTKLMGMGFQASDVKKTLAAVHRLVEKGNRVQFGPKVEDNFIENVESGEKVYLRKHGRS